MTPATITPVISMSSHLSQKIVVLARMAIAENRFRSPVVRYCTHDQSIGQRGQGFLAVSSQMVQLDNGYYSECTHGGRTPQAQSICEKGQTCHTHKYLVKGGGGSKWGGVGNPTTATKTTAASRSRQPPSGAGWLASKTIFYSPVELQRAEVEVGVTPIVVL